MDAYTGFIRNVKRADDAIRIARSTKPAFDRFLQVSMCSNASGLARYGYYLLVAKSIIAFSPENKKKMTSWPLF